MKTLVKFACALLALSLVGCSSLLPKPVEFGQRKVKPFPEASSKLDEIQRQAADLAKRKTREALEHAQKESASPAVLAPVREAADLAESVSISLGPPVSRQEYNGEDLSRALDNQVARFNQKVDGFKKRNDEDAGKKIEGTGLVSVPYFLWLGIVAGVILVIHLLLKAFGNVASVAAASNPIASGALAAARAGGSILKSGFSALVTDAEDLGKKITPELKSEYAALQAKLETLVEQHAQVHHETTK